MTNLKAIDGFKLEELEKLLIEINETFEKNTNNSIMLEEVLTQVNKTLLTLAAEENEILSQIKALKNH